MPPEKLVKSKQRVTEHGEVFTPAHIVEAMLDLVKGESERIDSRFLEPACGEGNFLKQVLRRKLATVQARYCQNEFERRHYALMGLMCIYGIELLADNAQLCRNNLAKIFTDFIDDSASPEWSQAAQAVLAVNIVQADALTMQTPDGKALTFSEWGYLGKGKFQRRDFKYDELTQRSKYESPYKNDAETGLASLFTEEKAQPFAPIKSYPPMTVAQIAGMEG